jgi:hypothetical protein
MLNFVIIINVLSSIFPLKLNWEIIFVNHDNNFNGGGDVIISRDKF